MGFSCVELSADDAAFLREVRAFLGEQVTDEVRRRDRELIDIAGPASVKPNYSPPAQKAPTTATEAPR